MDPITGTVATLLNAVQGAARADASGAGQVPALLALAGQERIMTLLGQTGTGTVTLALPSGQTVTAQTQGQLPYADGSQLRVQILAGTGSDAGVRLQIRQAAPSAPPAILGPLYRSEADTLQARLAQSLPVPELAELAQLFRLLGGGGGTAGGSGSGTGLPDGSRIQAELDALPAASLAGLKTLLALPAGATGAQVASALEAWLDSAAQAAGPAAARGPADLTATLLQRFQGLLERTPDLPGGEALGPWLGRLLGGEAGAGAGVQAGNAAGQNPAQALAVLLAGRGGAPAEVPETWETWLRAGVQVLSDPGASPQTAAFHAAQAREGTAYYELPLPWAPQQPLQLWVEADRDPNRRGRGPEPAQRVLLGLSFTHLGETRVGLARDPGGLRVRVWTEHPELLAGGREQLEAELGELGQAVDLKILPLTPGADGTIPTLRSQVAGSNLEALG
jgi:hypothetical protein